MARSILSLGIDCARAVATARRRRALNAGSGAPSFAATVISRASFENTLLRAASLLPLRCMMFLACEWPAMSDVSPRQCWKWVALYKEAHRACEADALACRRQPLRLLG